MKILVRNMSVNETDTTSETLYTECQAAFNSDGNITLRNFNKNNRNQDEIIILSYEETRALFKLFSKIGQANKNYDLPF